MSEDIQRTLADGILELRLTRPDKKNALTNAMYDTMTAALAEASADPAIVAVLISGAGDAFCAGNDISGFLPANRTNSAMLFIRAIAGFDKPLVAAVQGLAVGVGTTMLLHCDLVYAALGTRFTVPFTKLEHRPRGGVEPAAAAARRRVPRRRRCCCSANRSMRKRPSAPGWSPRSLPPTTCSRTPAPRRWR